MRCQRKTDCSYGGGIERKLSSFTANPISTKESFHFKDINFEVCTDFSDTFPFNASGTSSCGLRSLIQNDLYLFRL